MTSSPSQSDYLKLVLEISVAPALERQDRQPLPKVVPGPSEPPALKFARFSQETTERLLQSRSPLPDRAPPPY